MGGSICGGNFRLHVEKIANQRLNSINATNGLCKSNRNRYIVMMAGIKFVPLLKYMERKMI